MIEVLLLKENPSSKRWGRLEPSEYFEDRPTQPLSSPTTPPSSPISMITTNPNKGKPSLTQLINELVGQESKHSRFSYSSSATTTSAVRHSPTIGRLLDTEVSIGMMFLLIQSDKFPSASDFSSAIERKENKSQPSASSLTIGFTGIHNPANSCFMNAALQCLSNTRELRDYFLRKSVSASIVLHICSSSLAVARRQTFIRNQSDQSARNERHHGRRIRCGDPKSLEQ
jgi:hypothetical protein